MADERPVFVWRQPTPNNYETVWYGKRLMIRKDAAKIWTCWVEYANTKRCTSTCPTLRAAQAWCADIVLLTPPTHRTERHLPKEAK
jgi:hypothetical protein